MKKQIKALWDGLSFKSIGIWWWPLGFLMFLFDVVHHTIFNSHSFETFPTGTRCIWCGKPKTTGEEKV